jgi:hypothetical protein
MTLSWITKQDRYMKARVRPWRHGSKVDRHHVGYLLEISDTRALTGQNGYKKALTKPHDMTRWLTWTKEWTWLGVNDRQVLFRKVKQWFEINERRLSILNHIEAINLWLDVTYCSYETPRGLTIGHPTRHRHIVVEGNGNCEFMRGSTPSCERRTPRYKINTPSCCWNTTTGVHPWIHQENFKTKFFDTNVKSDLTASSSQKIQFLH